MEALALVRALDAPDGEVRLAELARSGAPVRRVLAALAGQLVARRAWDRLGYVRLRDYAVERLGLSARQVQDLAHVDRALRRLPGVDAAFVAGRLTWTKARLLCRVATPEDEDAWLDLAKRLTARALAREVRVVDARSLEAGGAPETDEDGVDEVPRTTVWLHVSPRVRARWGRARLLARQVAGEALSQAQAAEVIAAEVMSALGADVDPGVATPLHFPRANRCAEVLVGRESERSERIPPRAAGAPRASRLGELSPHEPRANGCAPHAFENLPAFLAPLLENLESADAVELDARLRRALRIERRNGRTASESEALDAMLEHCFATWAPSNAKIPSEHRVFERDGWRCTVPGCSSYRNLHSHHIWFRSDNGPDDPWNRTALCAAHHHRCVHEGIGRIRIRGARPTGFAMSFRS